MDDSRKAERDRDLELSAKSAFLFRESWCGSRKIEPRFSDSDGVEIVDRSTQVSNQRGLVLASQLRVQAESEINVRMTFPQCS